MNIRSFPLQLGFRGGPLDVLLGVVPSSSGVGHGNGELDGGDEGSDEEAGDSLDSEEGSGEEGGEHDHGSGGDHLPKGGDSGDLDAGIVVGALGGVLVKKVGLLVELPGDLHDHLHGGEADGLHGHGGEPEGDHTSDNEEGEGKGLEHVDAASLGEDSVVGESLDADDEGSEEGERDKGGRSDGESLSNGSGGVSGGVEGVGLLPNSGLELGHLGDSSSVVADRSVDVNGEAGGEVGEHTDGSKTDSVEVEEGERGVDDATEDDDGDDGTLVSEGDSVDHVGGGSSLATVGDLTDRGVRVGSVVLGDEADDKSTDGSSSDADEGGPGLDVMGDSDSDDFHSVIAIGEEDGGDDVDSGKHDEGGGDELSLEGELDVGLLLDGHDVGGDEGADEANKDSDSRDGDGEEKGIPSSVAGRVDGSASDDKGGAGGLGERAEKVRSHTGNISDVVSDVVSDSGRVARIILGDSVDDLSNEVGTDIGGLGVDSTSDAAKHGNAGASESVSGDAVAHGLPVVTVLALDDVQGDEQNNEAKSAEDEAHDGSGAEGGVEARGPSSLLGGDGGADVGVDGNLHSKVAGDHGGDGSKNEGEGGVATAGEVPPVGGLGSPRDEEEDEGAEASNKQTADPVLGLEEGLSSLVNGSVDLSELLASVPLRGTGEGGGGRVAVGAKRNGRNHIELNEAPNEGNRSSGAYENVDGSLSEDRGERGRRGWRLEVLRRKKGQGCFPWFGGQSLDLQEK